MRFLQKFWNKTFFSEFDPYPLAIFRIVLGFSILIILIASFPDWEDLYSNGGMMSLKELDLPVLKMDRLSLFHYLEPVISIKLFFWLGMIFSITFILGLFTRFSTLVLLILVHSMFYRNFLVTAGYDVVWRLLLCFSLFVPVNYYLSIDNLFNKKKKNLPYVWPVRLMQIGIASIYLITFYHKIIDDSVWLTGDAIYLVVANRNWSAFPYPELFYKWDGILSKLLTYATLILEIAFPFLVWFRQTNLLIILAMTIFHLCITIIMPVIFPFTLVMISSFILFLPTETIQKKP